VLPCGPRFAKIHASSHPFSDVFPVSPGGVFRKTPIVAAAVHDLLEKHLSVTAAATAPPAWPPACAAPGQGQRSFRRPPQGGGGASCGFPGLRFRYTRDPGPPQVGALRFVMVWSQLLISTKIKYIGSIFFVINHIRKHFS